MRRFGLVVARIALLPVFAALAPGDLRLLLRGRTSEGS